MISHFIYHLLITFYDSIILSLSLFIARFLSFSMTCSWFCILVVGSLYTYSSLNPSTSHRRCLLFHSLDQRSVLPILPSNPTHEWECHFSKYNRNEIGIVLKPRHSYMNGIASFSIAFRVRSGIALFVNFVLLGHMH